MKILSPQTEATDVISKAVADGRIVISTTAPSSPTTNYTIWVDIN